MANAETRQYKELGDVTSTGTMLVRDNLQGGGVGAIFVRGTPDGAVNGTKGQLAIDVVSRTTYQNMDGATTWGAYTPGGTGVAQSVYGDGSDGNATDPATLTRDMFYDTLSLSVGFVLNTGGFRLFAKQINGPTTGAAARIHRDGLDGNDGTASLGGAGVASPSSSGTLGGCSGGASGNGGGVASAGGQGSTMNGGITPWNGNASGSGAPGNSGDGGSGTGGNPAGARVDKSAPQTALLGNTRSLPWSILMRLSDSQSYQVNGGHDGPGGGGSTTGGGGAGASGAGVVVVCARKMTGRLSISAKGGKAGNAFAGSGAGGGAGGGGGWLTVVCESTGPEVVMSAAGGAGGTRGGAGTGTDGTAGGAGVAQLYVS